MSRIRTRRCDGAGRRAAAPIGLLAVVMLVASACGALSRATDTAVATPAARPAAVSPTDGQGPGPSTFPPTSATESSTSATDPPMSATDPPTSATESPTSATESSTTSRPVAVPTAVTDARDTSPRSRPAPVSIRLPSIDVDEQLINLGIAADGSAQVPQDYDRAGWFASGGRPGAVGPTVILGHVDSRDGPAVFYRLRDLAVGDSAELGLADGQVAVYRVTAVDQYAKDEFPTFAVYGATLDDVVRFVTCGGPFDDQALSYTENVVVTAVRLTG